MTSTAKACVADILNGLTFTKEPRTHNLVITADPAAMFALQLLYADEYPKATRLVRLASVRKGGPVMLRDLVGLTSSPQFASRVGPDNKPSGFLWWFPSYEVQNEWEALAVNGRVVFRFGAHIRPHRKNNGLLLKLRDDLDMRHGDDWDGAMGALFSVASELWWRGVHVPNEWRYSPGCAADPREPEDGRYEDCVAAKDDELLYAGNVLHRYITALERKRPRG